MEKEDIHKQVEDYVDSEIRGFGDFFDFIFDPEDLFHLKRRATDNAWRAYSYAIKNGNPDYIAREYKTQAMVQIIDVYFNAKREEIRRDHEESIKNSSDADDLPF